MILPLIIFSMFWFLNQCRVLLVLFYSITHRTILELGSGIGFTGIAICKTCQPRTFIFSDCHPRVLRQLGENIQLNGFTPEPDVTWSIQTESQGQEVEGQNCQNPKVVVAELDWGSVTEKQLLGLRADVVIAAGTAPTGSRDRQGSAASWGVTEWQQPTTDFFCTCLCINSGGVL